MLRISLLLLVGVLAAGGASGQPIPDDTTQTAKEFCRERFVSKGKNEVDCFVNSIRVARLMCQVHLLAGMSDEVRACIARGQRSMKVYYDLARPKAAKKKAADDAMKELYAYALSGLRGMEPETSETKGDYDRRQAQRKQGIEDRISRLDIEL